ncbi:MAG: hypothetical protein JWO84_549 [Parcubacteria group bacterium]|nr:hypothetical protein [Parcubacteria group bacterium]
MAKLLQAAEMAGLCLLEAAKGTQGIVSAGCPEMLFASISGSPTKFRFTVDVDLEKDVAQVVGHHVVE